MYFSQIRRNAARNRKDNVLFFSSLVIAIVAFYSLLSLESQDVIIFLRTLESDAIAKLMLQIPLVYGVSLFFVFFLVFFAFRYQLDSRKREFGLYLILGMKRGRLWAILMGETLLNSAIALVIGIPLALLLTEAVSLVTGKLVGLSIVGHSFSFSPDALIMTVVGFFTVQMVAMFFLSGDICKKEPLELLSSDAPQRQKILTLREAGAFLLGASLCLAASYLLGILLMPELGVLVTLAVLLLVGFGTFFAYKGLGAVIGRYLQKKNAQKTGLFIFTGRQVQENVLSQHKTMAVASLLLLLATTCVSLGIGTAIANDNNESKSVDISIVGAEEKVREVLDSTQSQQMISTYYPMYLDSMTLIFPPDTSEADPEPPKSPGFSLEGLVSALENAAESKERNQLIEDFSDSDRVYPYLIELSSYNALLNSLGYEPLDLGSRRVALFSGMLDGDAFAKAVSSASSFGATIEIGYETFELEPHFYTINVVADRKITIRYGLIVPDEIFQQQVNDPDTPFCWNAALKQQVVEERGLLRALMDFEEIIKDSGLEYETYLAGIGRSLFYVVSASYLALYLGVLFTIIANTVIGLKLLIQHRMNKHRYRTLQTLGAQSDDLSTSVKTQVAIFFGLVLILTALSSFFAVWALSRSYLRLPFEEMHAAVLAYAFIGAILFIGVECLYVYFVARVGDHEIRSLESEGQ